MIGHDERILLTNGRGERAECRELSSTLTPLSLPRRPCDEERTIRFVAHRRAGFVDRRSCGS